jgi:hypothetical protein
MSGIQQVLISYLLKMPDCLPGWMNGWMDGLMDDRQINDDGWWMDG